MQDQPNLEPTLTATQVARVLGVSRFSVYRAAREGRIGGVVHMGRTVRFDPSGFRAWVESGGTPTRENDSPRPAA